MISSVARFFTDIPHIDFFYYTSKSVEWEKNYGIIETERVRNMLDWLKHLLKKEELPPAVQKPVIITIHGYGRRRRNEFDEQDHDWMQWVSRAKEVVDSYRDSGRDIYLAGFSMGGVIASYLAVVCPVKRLLLLAPAFSYMNVDIITGVLTKSASSLMGNEKKEEIQLPRAFYGAFTELVKNLKKYIGFVECPVFIIHTAAKS